MPEHVSLSDLEGFAAGVLPREKRFRVVGHLVRGCPRCARILASAVGLLPHGRDINEAGYDVALARARERVLGRSARSGAIVMLLEILSGQRAWKDLSGGEIAALRGIPQVRALLEAGRSLRHHDPQATLRLAALARYAADRLSPTEFGQEAVADLRALAWAELANAHRVCDDLPRADRAMNRAIHWFRRGSCAPLLIARIADLLASLLGAQRRFADGQRILALVHQVYLREGQPHLAGRALVKAGSLAAWSGEPGRGIQLSRRGLELLEPQREPDLVAQALRHMISCLIDLGRFRSARRLLWQVRHVLVEYGNALDLLRIRWIEGRIYAGLSDFPRAEDAFRETRDGFAAKGQIYPAALAALDLAALWTRQGRSQEVCELAGEITETFRALRIAREATAALIMLQHVCRIESGNRALDIIELVVRFLKELERQPARRQSPEPDSMPAPPVPRSPMR